MIRGVCGHSSWHKYILVVCNYATRYLYVISLPSIDAENVAKELVKLFAGVGVLEKILTDQGSYFMSQLLT